MEIYTFQIILFYYIVYLISRVLTGDISVSHTFSWPHKKAERAKKAQAKKLQDVKHQRPHGSFGGVYGNYNLSSDDERFGMGSTGYGGLRSDQTFIDKFK